MLDGILFLLFSRSGRTVARVTNPGEIPSERRWSSNVGWCCLMSILQYLYNSTWDP